MVKLAIAFVYGSRAASRVDVCEVTEVSTLNEVVTLLTVYSYHHTHSALAELFHIILMCFKNCLPQHSNKFERS